MQIQLHRLDVRTSLTKSSQDAANSASIMIRGAMPVAVAMDLPLLVDLTTDKRAAA